MKKVIFGIFAHPDDEAFGPAGTLVQAVRSGTDVHLFTLTTGQAGMNPDNHADLGAVREQEWRRAGELIGASSMHSLGYHDGHLDNIAMQDAAERISLLIDTILSDYDEPVDAELLSLDTAGITGHIDHIVAGRLSCLLFYRHKATDRRFSRLRLACVTKSQLPRVSTDWLYAEPGHEETEVETVDARAYRSDILAVMQAHHTQRHDAEQHIAQRGNQLGVDYFIVHQ